MHECMVAMHGKYSYAVRRPLPTVNQINTLTTLLVLYGIILAPYLYPDGRCITYLLNEVLCFCKRTQSTVDSKRSDTTCVTICASIQFRCCNYCQSRQRTLRISATCGEGGEVCQQFGPVSDRTTHPSMYRLAKIRFLDIHMDGGN